MSEAQLAETLARYEGRSDEFAALVRGLVTDVRMARQDADRWHEFHDALRARLIRIVDIADGRVA